MDELLMWRKMRFHHFKNPSKRETYVTYQTIAVAKQGTTYEVESIFAVAYHNVSLNHGETQRWEIQPSNRSRFGYS